MCAFFWGGGVAVPGGGGGVYSRPLGEFNGGCDICNMENVFPFWCTAMSLQSLLQLDTHDESVCVICVFICRDHPPVAKMRFFHTNLVALVMTSFGAITTSAHC